ncbi:MAG: DUF4168 domain-containing protein [Balneolaceae bacterium]
MYYMKRCFTIMVMLFVGTQLAFTQGQQPQQQPDVPSPDEISDEELIRFAETSDNIQPIQQKAQGEIEQVVEEEGMSFDRFRQVMMAMQNPQMQDQMDISSDEEETIQAVQPKLMEIQMEAEKEIVSEIENRGLNVERYQAIFYSLQQHSELMERLEGLMDE